MGWHEANGHLLLNFCGGRGGGTSGRNRSIGSRSNSALSSSSRSSHCGGVRSGRRGRRLGSSSRSFNGSGRLRLARRQTSGQGKAQGSKFQQVVHFGGNFENGLTKKRPLSRLHGKVTQPEKLFYSSGYLPPAIVLTIKVNEQRQFRFFDAHRRRIDCRYSQRR